MLSLTLARGVLFLMSAELSEIMCGSWPGTLVSDRIYGSVWHTVVLWNFGIRCPSRVIVADFQICSYWLVMPGQDSSGPGNTLILRDGYWAFREIKIQCGCYEMLFFRVCGVRQNFYVFSLYRNPDQDDRIFDCLLTSMAAMQAEDVQDSWMFVGIWMTIIRCGWVLRPRIVMVLQPLTLQLCVVAISWLSVRSMHVVEHLTSCWLMFMT